MFFVCMRSTNDMSANEKLQFAYNFRLLKQLNVNPNNFDENSKILLAELLVRFHKEYDRDVDAVDEWNVAYYKVAGFKVLTI